jgi:flagellin-like protein
MKKVWKNEEAVSPVIATILMVAITVVLAAVLYVMVMNIDPDNNGPPLAGTWQSVGATSSTSGKLVLGAFTQTVTPTTLKLIVRENGTEVGAVSWRSDTDPSQVTWINAPTGASVTYYDYNALGGQINSGDYVELSGLKSGTKYDFELFNLKGDAVVTMSGNAGFTTPS